MEHYVYQNIVFIIILAISAQWIGWKLKIPVIILLTLFGVTFGPVLNLIEPRAILGPLLPNFIELAVAIILFEGGMSLKIHEFKESSKGLLRLFSIAVLVSWLLGAISTKLLTNLSNSTSFLISSILIVTGPTVIIPALRQAKLSKKVANYLKWEGIINDPIGAMLAALVLQFELYRNSEFIFFAIIKIILIAISFAWITRYLLIKASQRALFPEFLKIPFFIGIVLTLFLISELLQKGSGLLTATFLGLFIGNINISSIKELRRFGESLTIFTVSIIFIVLSAGIDITIWKELTLNHYILILLFSFVIRPVSIYLSTFQSGINLRERILIGMYGPRGIVAASVAGVSSQVLIDKGIEEAKLIVPIIFSVIVVTVIIHGLWLKTLAKKLNLISVGEHGVIIVGATRWSIQLAKIIKEIGLPVIVTDTSWYQLAQARQEGVETHFGQILEDREIGEPDLSEFNYLFAFTEDDSYNSLVCESFGHELGFDHVYKLLSGDNEYKTGHKLTRKNFCELSEKNEPLFENLMQKIHHGHHFKHITFTDSFSFKDFKREKMKSDILILITVRSNNRVELFSFDAYMGPKIGDSIIYYEK